MRSPRCCQVPAHQPAHAVAVQLDEHVPRRPGDQQDVLLPAGWPAELHLLRGGRARRPGAARRARRRRLLRPRAQRGRRVRAPPRRRGVPVCGPRASCPRTMRARRSATCGRAAWRWPSGCGARATWPTGGARRRGWRRRCSGSRGGCCEGDLVQGSRPWLRKDSENVSGFAIIAHAQSYKSHSALSRSYNHEGGTFGYT